jgi:hypothetical protein
MSFNSSNKTHEEIVEEYLKDISNQLRLLVAINNKAFDSEIEQQNIPKLEDCEDDT